MKTIKAFSEAEKLSLVVLDKMKLTDMKEFVFAQKVIFQTIMEMENQNIEFKNWQPWE
ncbi:MAG: hypothetical protein GOVbin2056_25 [Prokaryotic dsDNA virus sp.]|nr:MAG: hypothetical protein GOVbin2056_25 [Prokaryotic dsDNA virus sp.]|tara:strand:- start:5826 stop:5999 length:174 start_codon:yes stop_codon:yes gene_type:complete